MDDKIQLFCPEFLFEEFLKYKDYILTKTHRSNEDFNKFYTIITNKITVVPEKNISPFLKQAEEISPDLKDIVYLALAISINANLWSNDKKLKDKKSTVAVFSTKQLVNELELGK